MSYKPLNVSDKAVRLAPVWAAAGLSFVALSWWLLQNPVADFIEHAPGMDNRPANFTSRSERVNIGAFFASFDGQPAEIEGSWPRFRGKDFDNINKESIALSEKWDQNGPNVLWSLDLGEGHAGPVVSNGRVYVMDYDETNRRDLLRCFSFQDGSEIWQRGYDIYVKRNHGMSRTVPAIRDNYVVTMGPMCQVMCVTADSGRFVWGIDIAATYESEVPLWYTGQCLLLDGSQAIIATGGKALLIAVDLKTGNIDWQTANPDNWKMSHASVIPMTIAGKRMYVYCAVGGMVAVSAEDDAGKLLFATNEWNHNVVAPSPVLVSRDRIFVTSGYGAGSMLFQVKREGEHFSIAALQTLKPGEGLAAEQQTPIYFKEHLFAILPKDAGALRNQFVCYHPDDCSKVVWASGKTNRFGLGPYLVADDKFFILSDEGVLTVAKASNREYTQLAQTKILQGHDAWGPMVIVEGRLLARDSRRLVCVDLRAQK